MFVALTAHPDDIRRATRFYWIELAFATLASIASNVTHAVLNAGGHGPLVVAVSAAVAIVPPIVLLASTHSLALLVKISGTGAGYWVALFFALMMTIALAGCAFTLSFNALKGLAASYGVIRGLAWLWPLAIDLSIAHATLSLLVVKPKAAVATDMLQTLLRTQAVPGQDPHRGGEDLHQSQELAHNGHHVDDADDELARLTGLGGYDWTSVAETLVREGRSQQNPTVVAQIISLHQSGMKPFAISQKLGVHRSTVNRVIEATREVLQDVPVPSI